MDIETETHPPLVQTKSMNKVRFKHNIEMEDKKYDDTWESCCVKMDKRAIRFFTQLGISVGIISLCIVQLLRLSDCSSQHAYIGLLTLLIGIWLPSPSMNK